MTDAEKAERIVAEWWSDSYPCPSLVAAIAAALRAEREECARVVDESRKEAYFPGTVGDVQLQGLAAAIRARA